MVDFAQWQKPWVRDFRGTNAARPDWSDRGLESPAFKNAGASALVSAPGKNQQNAGRPLLLIGRLEDLTPKSITVDAHRESDRSRTIPKRTFDTSGIDFRRVEGFEGALKSAIIDLDPRFSSVGGAEVQSVNSNRQLIASIKNAGQRQVIYFGHAAGPGALWPGGIEAKPTSPRDFANAVDPQAPRPILIGCHAANQSLVGQPTPANAIGLNRLLVLKDLGAEISDGARNHPSIKSVRVRDIQLGQSAKGFAPQAPLPNREAHPFEQ